MSDWYSSKRRCIALVHDQSSGMDPCGITQGVHFPRHKDKQEEEIRERKDSQQDLAGDTDDPEDYDCDDEDSDDANREHKCQPRGCQRTIAECSKLSYHSRNHIERHSQQVWRHYWDLWLWHRGEGKKPNSPIRRRDKLLAPSDPRRYRRIGPPVTPGPSPLRIESLQAPAPFYSHVEYSINHAGSAPPEIRDRPGCTYNGCVPEGLCNRSRRVQKLMDIAVTFLEQQEPNVGWALREGAKKLGIIVLTSGLRGKDKDGEWPTVMLGIVPRRLCQDEREVVVKQERYGKGRRYIWWVTLNVDIDGKTQIRD